MTKRRATGQHRSNQRRMFQEPIGELVGCSFDSKFVAVILEGDARETLTTIPDGSVKLIITSPPYNIGKAYERATDLDAYLANLQPILDQLLRVLHENGSLCWQVGNYVEKSEVFPLDIEFAPIFNRHNVQLRNRIIGHFGRGLRTRRRFSGRYEVVLWYTKSDRYKFNLDAVRVPSKCPGKKHFKGPRKGMVPGNPLGEDTEDVWTNSNVKSNHPEKTSHPCQFSVSLIERLALATATRTSMAFDTPSLDVTRHAK